MDYGKIKLINIDTVWDFWTLHDEMVFSGDNTHPMKHNRECYLDAFRKGTLFGLQIQETDSMFRRGARGDDVFAKNKHGHPSFYLLPCLIIVEDDGCVCWIWVHPRIRKMGYGKALVELSKAKHINEMISGSEEFWQKLGIFPKQC